MSNRFWLVVVLVLAVTALIGLPHLMLTPKEQAAANDQELRIQELATKNVVDIRENAIIEVLDGQWIVISEKTIPITGGMEMVFVARKGDEENIFRAYLNKSAWSTEHMSAPLIRGTEVQITHVFASSKYRGMADHAYFAY